MMNILELIKTALRFGQTPPVYPSRCLLQLGVCSLQRFPRTLDFFFTRELARISALLSDLFVCRLPIS
jgi:hypothetical protein